MCSPSRYFITDKSRLYFHQGVLSSYFWYFTHCISPISVHRYDRNACYKMVPSYHELNSVGLRKSLSWLYMVKNGKSDSVSPGLVVMTSWWSMHVMTSLPFTAPHHTLTAALAHPSTCRGWEGCRPAGAHLWWVLHLKLYVMMLSKTTICSNLLLGSNFSDVWLWIKTCVFFSCVQKLTVNYIAGTISTSILICNLWDKLYAGVSQHTNSSIQHVSTGL